MSLKPISESTASENKRDILSQTYVKDNSIFKRKLQRRRQEGSCREEILVASAKG